ncbi:MAG TPA: GNAT family N-acetyltransferase [Terriglobales bacterium]|nr:GNAT family N-acetyltransferase [Terriglobales bacterium]
MIRVRQVTTNDEFERLGPTWNDLLGRSTDVYSTWEWLSCWWKHFGQRRELRVLVAEEDGKTMAIAPLMLSKRTLMNSVTVAKLEFIGGLESDYNDFIWVENGQECLNLFLKYLSELTDWDCIELTNVRENSLTASLLRHPHSDLMFEERVVFSCPYIELPTTVEEFMTTLSRDMRHQMRRKMRRLEETHGVNFKSHTEFSSIKEAMNQFFDLHEMRWRSRRKSDSFASGMMKTFQIELAERFAKKGWLALSFLTADDRSVAADYSFDYHERRYGYQSGFDPDFGSYAVGTLLRMHNVESCIAKGLKEYDFTRGGEAYKLRWPIQVRRNLQIRFARGGLITRLRLLTKDAALRLASKLH